jgi:hypothetical protein
VVLLAPFSVSGVVSSRVSKADSLSIASRSWLSYKRGVSGCFGDIGQVLEENFDWLPFTPSGRLLRSFNTPSPSAVCKLGGGTWHNNEVKETTTNAAGFRK